jgi:RNA polymerase sigma-70 factor, ECF subfamily
VARNVAGFSLEQLADLCRNRDESEAWEELILRTHRMVAAVIRSTLGRWGARDTGSVDDLAQEVYVKFSGNLARGFGARHPGAVLGYLRATAVSVAHDHFKSATAFKRGAGAPVESIDDTAPAAVSDGARQIERNVLLRQISDIIGEFPPRDRAIFWLYYRHGLATSAISEIPHFQLSAKGVESVIARLTRVARDRLGGSAPLPGPKKKDIVAENSL